jgi:hypothetical protein
MKRFIGLVTLSVLVLWAAFGAHWVHGQTGYYKGGKCVTSANCANCLSGFWGAADAVACPNAPNWRCLVAKGDAAQATFANCVQDPDSTNGCAHAGILNPPIVCQDMKYWWCGCATANGQCDTSACNCTGDNDGVTTYTVSYSVCADNPVGGGGV